MLGASSAGGLSSLCGRLAGHQDEHLAGFVVAESHLADLPLRLSW